MADIRVELAAIMAAVYGEEVRGSIHDAIAKINEVSEATLTIGTDITEPTSSVEGYFEKSVYINSETNDVWLCTGDAWELQGNIKGDKGDKGERGATWFRGTTVAGKSATPKSFDIQAAEGDMYINVTEQSIYHCTEGGRPSKWSYDFTMSAGGGGGSVDIDGVTITENAAGEIQVADALTTKLDKLDTNATAEEGQALAWDGEKYTPQTVKGGHDMYKELSEIPKDEDGYVDIPSTDEHVMSAHAVFEVANTKTYMITVEAKLSDGYNNGVGTWCDDVENYNPLVDSIDWIGARADHPEDEDISNFLKTLDGKDNVVFTPVFDAETNEPVYCGGYQVDLTNGRFCIKFGNEITKDAIVGFEVKVVTKAN